MRVGSGSGGSGTTYLTYNSGSGYNCVVTIGDYPGTTRWMEAWIEVSGGEWNKDSNYYKHYAGPRYVYGRGHCIDWAGFESATNNSLITLKFGTNCG
ncbi:hypothetical protein ACWGQ4_03645 [Streptomyces sp. NPDC055721]|uniref:hypothetical protein n=1 Tax=Streptomyces sp. NPDC127132 TaxID=3345374 RepID=UPI00362A14C2